MVDELLLGLEPLGPADRADGVEELLAEFVLEGLEAHLGAVLAAAGAGDLFFVHGRNISAKCEVRGTSHTLLCPRIQQRK